MTIKQVADGRMIDLMDPRPEDVDFRGWVAGTLARTPRFGGAISGGALSTAQHMVIGARAILRDTRNRELAAAFLLHDGHEAVVGDLTTPTAQAIAETAYLQGRQINAVVGGMARGLVTRAIHDLKDRLDAVIYPAAGIAWPLPAHVAAAVKDWDARMLETERRLFLGPGRAPWALDGAPPSQIKWPEKPRIWPWPEAEAAWLGALHDLCPATRPLAA